MSVRPIIIRISHLVTVHWSCICNTRTINQLSSTFITTTSMFLVSLGLTVLLLGVSLSVCFGVCISCMPTSSHIHSRLINLKHYKTCSPRYSLHSYIAILNCPSILTCCRTESEEKFLSNIVDLHHLLALCITQRPPSTKVILWKSEKNFVDVYGGKTDTETCFVRLTKSSRPKNTPTLTNSSLCAFPVYYLHTDCQTNLQPIRSRYVIKEKHTTTWLTTMLAHQPINNTQHSSH